MAAGTVYEGQIRPSSSPSSSSAEAEAPASRPWLLRLALALTLVPLAVSAVHLSVRYGNAYKPGGDLALAELWARDVGRHPVLTGVISRDGWHHPGPVAYYLMAVPYRLLGSRATAMDVAALAINAAAVTGVALYARRRGGDALMLISLVGCAVLMRSLGPDELRLPWNPYVTVLPYALLVFLTWSLVRGDRWALPWAVFVASFVTQTHIGYVALAVPLVVLGVGGLVVVTARAARRDGVDGLAGLRGLRAPSLAALGVAVVVWVLPLYQQVSRSPGNLAGAFRWFRGGGAGEDGPQTARVGWRVVSSQLGLPPEWLWGNRGVNILTAEPIAFYEPLAPLLLVGVVAAMLVLARRKVAGGPSLVAVWAVASVAGIVAVARTIGPVFEYRLGWSQVLGMLAGVIIVWAVWLVVAARSPRLEQRLLMPLALVVLAALAVVGSVAHVQVGEPQPVESAQVREVMPGVVEGLPPGDGPVLVDAVLSFGGSAHAASIALQLDRLGIDARYADGDTAAGEHRQIDPAADFRAQLWVAAGVQIAAVEAEPGTTLLAQAEGRLPDGSLVDEDDPGTVTPWPSVAVFLVDEVATDPTS